MAPRPVLSQPASWDGVFGYHTICGPTSRGSSQGPFPPRIDRRPFPTTPSPGWSSRDDRRNLDLHAAGKIVHACVLELCAVDRLRESKGLVTIFDNNLRTPHKKPIPWCLVVHLLARRFQVSDLTGQPFIAVADKALELQPGARSGRDGPLRSPPPGFPQSASGCPSPRSSSTPWLPD